MNAIGPGGKILIWAQESAKGNRVREIQSVTVMGETEKKGKNKSVGWEYSQEGKRR